MAIIERTTGSTFAPKAWDPDALPEPPESGRITLLEIGMTLAFNVLLIVGLLWVQLLPPVTVEGSAYPLFDPALWSFWLPWFLVVMVLELVFTVVLYQRGRWTWNFALVNTALGAAFAIPAAYLLQNGLLLNPELVAAIAAQTPDGWLSVTTLVTAIVVVVVAAGDAMDGFLKARRATLRRAD
jgi:hypothetical protein